MDRNSLIFIKKERAFALDTGALEMTKDAKEEITALFTFGQERVYHKSEIEYIPEELVSFFRNCFFADYFSASTWRSGKKNVQEGLVSNVIYSAAKKGIVGIVAERDKANQAIIKLNDNGDIIAGCTSCPGNTCRHVASLLCYMNVLMAEADAAIKNKENEIFLNNSKPDKASGSFASVSSALSALKEGKECIYQSCRTVTDHIDNNGSGEYLFCLDMAKAELNALKAQELICALTLANRTKEKFSLIIEANTGKYRKYSELKSKAEKEALYRDSWARKENTGTYKVLEAFYNHNAAYVAEHLFDSQVNIPDKAGFLDICMKDVLSLSREEYIDTCIKLKKADGGKKQSLAVKYAEKLPNSQYLVSFIRNYNEYYSYYSIPVSDIRPITDEEMDEVDRTAVYEYFTSKWNVLEKDNAVYLKCKLSLKDRPAEVLDFLVSTNGEIEVTRNRIENRKFSPIANAVLEDILSADGEAISREKASAEAALQRRLYQENVKKLSDKLDDLSRSIGRKKIILDENSLADVEFTAEPRSDHSGLIYWIITMRIGQNKMYVVKDAYRFIKMFNTGETAAYGKMFSFTHRLDNISKEKREALELLILCASSGDGDYFHDRKALSMNGNVFFAFLKAMQGNSLIINDTHYEVRLEELPCMVTLSNKCELTASVSGMEGKAILSGENLIFLNDTEKTVDIVRGTEDQKKLYNFAISNNGENFGPVLNQFTDKIYSRFYADINIPDELKDRMHLSDLEISAYFDYENGAITVKTEICRDDVKLEPKTLQNRMDLTRYTNYLDVLETLGFQDSVMKNDADILAFLSMDMTALKRHCKVFLSDSITSMKIRKFGSPVVRISYESEIMQCFLEGSEYSGDELKKILSAVRKGKKFVLLKGNRIIDLSDEDASSFEKTVDDLGLDTEKLCERQILTTTQALRAFAHESNCRIDEYLYKMFSEIRNFKTSKISVPQLNARLRPYQVEGFRYLRILSDYHVGGILADDMGLGKTIQFIALLKSDPEPRADLVVCPKSLVFNWINEFHRFAPDTVVKEVYGLPSKRQEIIRNIDYSSRTVYVTSYDSLRNDIELYDNSFRYLVLDEAQYIKNVNSLKSRSAKLLKASHRFALTGTPIENSVLDLWSIFDFIMPGYLDDLNYFRSEYSRNVKYTDLISRKISPFILRRTKRDVLKDLPDKYERILTVEMHPEQRKLYDAFKLEAAEALAAGSKAFDVLPYLMRLRQICDAPSMVADNYHEGSGKLDALNDILDNYLSEDHRILIFSQFVRALELVRRLLEEKRIPYYLITGDTPAKDRISQMNAFNEENEISVFLISLKAGGTGLNLTGADTVIHLDPWWNVAAEDQASDRAHRIGQKRNVEVIKLICEDSVEQRVIELQNMKKDIIDRLISNNDGSVTGLSLEDISFILQ